VAKAKPVTRSFAEVVGQWRPEVLAAAVKDPEDLEVDEDLEAVAAAEALTAEEAARLRIRYLKERRQAALRAGPLCREDVLSCEAEIERLQSEVRQQRPWPVRAQAAADALRAASAKAEALRGDLDAARAAVEAIAEELATAEADQVAAQAAMDEVQAEAGRSVAAGQPSLLTPQDAEVVGTLRGLVGATGMSVQALMAALVVAVGSARAAGPAAGPGLAGGSPSRAAAAAEQTGPTTGGSPTSVVSVGGSLTPVRRVGGGGPGPAAADVSPTLSEVVALELAGAAASPEQRVAALPMLAALSPGPTQPFSPSGAGSAQGVPVPGDVNDQDEDRPAAARGRSRSPRQTEL